MALAEELLEQAHRLAKSRGRVATQADLRRAVSTAYYALFHLLAEDAGRRWQGSSAAAETGLQRALDHTAMRNASALFQKPSWTDWRGGQLAVPSPLRRVAEAFIDLQDGRQLADYANHETWSVVEADEYLEIAREAFQDWASIRHDPMAGNFLLSMLLGKRR